MKTTPLCIIKYTASVSVRVITFYLEVSALDDYRYSYNVTPSHSNSLGSGSQYPFSIHVDSLEPKRTCPLGQINEALVPTRAGSSKMTLTESSASITGWIHLAVCTCVLVT